jgi:SCY1-like protein 1
LLADTPKARADVALFVQNTTKPNGYFSSDFVQANLFLENINIKDANDKEKFFRHVYVDIHERT